MSYIGKIASGLKTLLVGLRITGKQSIQKPVTQTYPHVEPELTPAYRSAIKLIHFDEIKTHDCVACLACEQICPSFCIKIEGGKIEGIKKKRATKFEMDFALCSLCGLCIDVCPTATLEYTKLYDEASYDRHWVYDLLDDYRDFEPTFIEQQKEREAKLAAEKAAKAAAAKAAKEKAEQEKAAKEAAEGAKGDAKAAGDEKSAGEGSPDSSDAKKGAE